MKDQEKTKEQLIEELAEMRRRIDALMNNLPEGIVIVDAPTVKIREVSRYGLQMIGVSAEEIEGIEGTGHFRYYQMYRPDGSEPALEELPLARALFGAEVIRNEEWLLQTRDGNRTPILCHAGPVRDPDGTITGAVVSWQDVTKRKQTEEQLRESEDRTAELAEANDNLQREVDERKRVQEALRDSRDELQAIYDNMVDGLLIGDCATGRLLRTNPAMCRMLGYSPDELLSKFVTDIHPVEATPQVLEKFRTQREGQRLLTQNRPMLRKDGAVFYADISNVRITYQGRPCIIGIFRDITERKQAQEALQQAHDELRAIHDGMVDGVLIVDARTKRFVRANASICRMLGYSVEELLAMSVKDIHPARDLPAIVAAVDALAQGRIREIADLPVLRRDGSVFFANISTGTIVYQGGLCVLGVFRDITERKQAQEALERERQSLWKMLQASDHERQVIAYDIHDGLAQYLAAAGMQFQAYDALRENAPKEAQTAYRTAIELVRQAHGESRRLISEVRPPVIDEIGLETAISHLVHEQRRRGGPTIECHSSVQFRRLPQILENALYRIVQEALTNACRHSKSKKVTVTLTQEGQEVRLEVQDWGGGFDPESVETGHFGLEGIRQRVRLLGGQLKIDSKPGSGTLVQVVVPILERQDS